MPLLSYIPPTELSSVWHLVRHGLERIKLLTCCHWIPEDVYSKCRTNQATLHIGYDETGEFLGFFVLELQQELDGPVLHIWCGYNAGERDLVAEGMAEVEAMARQAGAIRLTFSTTRQGFARGFHDFRPMVTVYEREL